MVKTKLDSLTMGDVKEQEALANNNPLPDDGPEPGGYYDCHFTGEAFAQDPVQKGKTLVPYDVVASLPAKALDNLIGTFRDQWVPRFLGEELGDSSVKSVYSYYIQSVEPMDGADPDIPAKYMSREQLKRLIKIKHLNEIEPDIYGNVADLRTAVRLCFEEDPYFKVFQGRIRETSGDISQLSKLREKSRKKSKTIPTSTKEQPVAKKKEIKTKKSSKKSSKKSEKDSTDALSSIME